MTNSSLADAIRRKLRAEKLLKTAPNVEVAGNLIRQADHAELELRRLANPLVERRNQDERAAMNVGRR
jgi:hypothetical protein